MKYPIRIAAKDEYDKLGKLYEKAFDHVESVLKYYTGFKDYLSFFVEKNSAFVIEKEETICGAALVYETLDMFCGRSLYIDFLAVLPECQNEGMGRALIEYVYDEARRRAITAISAG